MKLDEQLLKMKITKSYLKQIIKEERNRLILESSSETEQFFSEKIPVIYIAKVDDRNIAYFEISKLKVDKEEEKIKKFMLKDSIKVIVEAYEILKMLGRLKNYGAEINYGDSEAVAHQKFIRGLAALMYIGSTSHNDYPLFLKKDYREDVRSKFLKKYFPTVKFVELKWFTSGMENSMKPYIDAASLYGADTFEERFDMMMNDLESRSKKEEK